MKIHEYQAKELFRKASVPVLEGQVARSPEEASAAFKALGKPLAVVKAQVHAGGRGKGTVIGNPSQRGVQLVRSADEAAQVAKNLIGNRLQTIQTGPKVRSSIKSSSKPVAISLANCTSASCSTGPRQCLSSWSAAKVVLRSKR